MHPARSPGLVLGRYRPVARLGRGGMSTIDLARAEGAAAFARPVVIKRMITDSEVPDAEQMFVREARILAALRHPGVVGVADFGTHDDELVMVLEYVPGYDLAQWLKYRRAIDRPLPAEAAIAAIVRVLDTLAYLHDHRREDGCRVRVLHRDVSPSNVLLDACGRVLLTDFGIATLQGGTQLFATQRRSLKGKVPYMAPELLTRHPMPTPATDVYAAAVMLHELLVGRNEIACRDLGTMIARVQRHAWTPIAAVRDDAPDEIDAVLSRALAKDPAARFESARELADALRALAPHGERILAAEAERDLRGSMPAALGLPTLDERDRAWRRAEVASAVPAIEAEAPRPGASRPPTAPTIVAHLHAARRVPLRRDPTKRFVDESAVRIADLPTLILARPSAEPRRVARFVRSLLALVVLAWALAQPRSARGADSTPRPTVALDR